MKKIIFVLMVSAVSLSAQSFGFGFDDDGGSFGIANNSFAVSIGGDASASMVGYLEDFSNGMDHTRLGDIFSGNLNFLAKTSAAEGVFNLKLNPSLSPVSINEAYLRAFFGNLEITGGLRKLTWGKAESLGPLDVINPLNTSEIYTTMADQHSLIGVKIARPLIHASLRIGQFSKLEGVFVPWFEPHLLSQKGRWAFSEMEMLTLAQVMGIIVKTPDTTTLDYAQTGFRFTTTLGSSDIGMQYYYGRLPQPSVGFIYNLPDPMPEVSLIYNPYHQIGFDFAQVLFGFNLRAELAANITEDLKGDDGSVYNPSLAWSFGFDRDLFSGINLNFQVNESIRLFNNKTGSEDFMSGNFDIEGASAMTSTRLTSAFSKKFLRDELEARAAFAWGIEDKDLLLLPALIWTKDDVRIAFSGGFFIGDSDGQLGQYKDNNFLKISLTYSF